MAARSVGGSAQPRLVRANRDLEDGRGFDVGQTEVVVRDEYGALLGGQMPEATVQLISDRERGMDVIGPRRIEGEESDFDCATASNAIRLSV